MRKSAFPHSPFQFMLQIAKLQSKHASDSQPSRVPLFIRVKTRWSDSFNRFDDGRFSRSSTITFTSGFRVDGTNPKIFLYRGSI